MVRSNSLGAKPKRQGPSLRTHHNGQWTVRLKGRDYYLGSIASVDLEEAQRRRFELLATGGSGAPPKKTTAPSTPHDGKPSSVEALVARYMDAFCKRRPHYRSPLGKPAAHARDVADGLALLVEHHGSIPTSHFRKKDLVQLRDEMVQRNLARTTINRRLARIKELFRWGAERDLVPESTWTALTPIKGITAGEGKPRRKVLPVDEATVEATIPYLTEHFRPVVRLLQLSGARASEILKMKRRDLDMNCEEGLWLYTPQSHKTEWRGQSRRIWFGEQAQAVLQPLLPLDPDAAVFCPRRAREERRKALRRARKSKLTPSQKRRDATRRRKNLKSCRPFFTAHTLRNAVTRACQKAGVPRWHVHQLRHAFATRGRRECGLEATRAAVGHTSVGMTEHYANLDRELGAEVARRIG